MLSSDHHAHIAQATRGGESSSDQAASQRGTWLSAARDALEDLQSASASLVSCELTVSLFKGIAGGLAGSSGSEGKILSRGSVDSRGRRSAEITLTRRNLFLSGRESVGFSVPSVDDVASTLCAQASNLSEAPSSGSWRGRYFDGFAWQTADFTLFFQDLIARETTGARNGRSGGSSLDVMGSCGSHATLGCVAVSGNYDPDTGRLAWSQPAPPGAPGGDGAVWETWGQMYAGRDAGGEGGQVVDRIFASYQDSAGRRGNVELVLCEGSIPPFAVGNSYWSHTGLDLFVHQAPPPAPKAVQPRPVPTAPPPRAGVKGGAPVTLPPGWSLPPGQCPLGLSAPPEGTRTGNVGPAPGARAAASLGEPPLAPLSVGVRGGGVRGESVLEDPSNTLV